MYDELVTRLWECASGECFNCSQYTPTTNASVCQKELMKQAADAIEELSKRVPKVPHGRLIDADALCEGLVSNHPVAIYAKSAPTIIPAEPGEEETT